MGKLFIHLKFPTEKLLENLGLFCCEFINDYSTHAGNIRSSVPCSDFNAFDPYIKVQAVQRFSSMTS